MAEETDVKTAKNGKSPIVMILVVLVILLLLAVGGIGYFIYSKGLLNDEPTSQEPMQKQNQVTEQVDIGETYQASIDSLVLNITDAKGRPKLMKLSFTMKAGDPMIEGLIETNKAEMVDSVIRQISARSSEELLTVGGKAMLKEEMIDELNNILNDASNDDDVMKNMILDIFFTAFVIK